MADAIEIAADAKHIDSYTVDNVIDHPVSEEQKVEAQVHEAIKVFNQIAKHIEEHSYKKAQSAAIYPPTKATVYRVGHSKLGKRRSRFGMLHERLEEEEFLREKNDRLKRLKYSY